jgi:hypothetical protein
MSSSAWTCLMRSLHAMPTSADLRGLATRRSHDLIVVAFNEFGTFLDTLTKPKV